MASSKLPSWDKHLAQLGVTSFTVDGTYTLVLLYSSLILCLSDQKIEHYTRSTRWWSAASSFRTSIICGATLADKIAVSYSCRHKPNIESHNERLAFATRGRGKREKLASFEEISFSPQMKNCKSLCKLAVSRGTTCIAPGSIRSQQIWGFLP
jgi:hypothetical protein